VGRIWFDIAMQEGVGGVAELLRSVPARGCHDPVTNSLPTPAGSSATMATSPESGTFPLPASLKG
jgi:hypothetical protein